MNLADVFTITFVTIGFVLAYIAYWLLAAGLFPGFVARAADKLGQAPVKSTLLGAVAMLPLLIGGLMASGKVPNGLAKLVFLVIALTPLLLSFFGSAGLALRIGRGLRSGRDEQEPWRAVLRGSTVLALTFILPVIGWFGVLPLTFLSGFGAFLLCAFERRHVLAAPPLPVEEPALSTVS